MRDRSLTQIVLGVFSECFPDKHVTRWCAIERDLGATPEDRSVLRAKLCAAVPPWGRWDLATDFPLEEFRKLATVDLVIVHIRWRGF